MVGLLRWLGLAGTLFLGLGRIFGQTVETWTPIGPDAATIFSLIRDPFDDEGFYAGTYFGGLYQSRDGGTTWQHVSSPFSGAVIFAVAADPSSPGTLLVGTLASGMYRTIDRGQT